MTKMICLGILMIKMYAKSITIKKKKKMFILWVENTSR